MQDIQFRAPQISICSKHGAIFDTLPVLAYSHATWR